LDWIFEPEEFLRLIIHNFEKYTEKIKVVFLVLSEESQLNNVELFTFKMNRREIRFTIPQFVNGFKLVCSRKVDNIEETFTTKSYEFRDVIVY